MDTNHTEVERRRNVNRHDLKLTRNQLLRDIREMRRTHESFADEIRREAVLAKTEIDRHFELKLQHFVMLEKSVDARFGEVAGTMARHLMEDERVHAQILSIGAERMQAAKDLLSSAVAGVVSSNNEVKENLKALATTVTLNQTNSVSMETFIEFRRSVEKREQEVSTWIAGSAGERQGIKSTWGMLISSALVGAALVSVIQFAFTHIK